MVSPPVARLPSNASCSWRATASRNQAFRFLSNDRLLKASS